MEKSKRAAIKSQNRKESGRTSENVHIRNNRPLLEKIGWEYTHFLQSELCRSHEAIYASSLEIEVKKMIAGSLKEYLEHNAVEKEKTFLCKENVSDEIYREISPAIEETFQKMKTGVVEYLRIYFSATPKEVVAKDLAGN